MANSQVVAIIGSTGVQGSGVLNSVLQTPHPVRALTRSPSKLPTNLNLTPIDTDISSPDSLEAGLKDAWALFVNTFSDYSKPEGTEAQLLRSIIDAAANAGVEYLILSTLPSGMPARAYVEKSQAMEYAKEMSKTTNLKPIFVQMGWYMSGFSGYMKPAINETDGHAEFVWSTVDKDTLFPLVSAYTDLGPVVKAIPENPAKWVNVEIPVVGDVLTIPQVAKTYTEVTGHPACALFVDHVPQEQIPQWTERHRGYKEVGYFPKYNRRAQDIPNLARELYPGMLTFEQWLKSTKCNAKE